MNYYSVFIPISVGIIVYGAVLIQHEHYEFLNRKYKIESMTQASDELVKMRKDLDDCKKRVDALTVRAGFKT